MAAVTSAALATGVWAQATTPGSNAPGSKAKPSSARGASVSSTYQPIDFAALPGWAADDHLAAFKAFELSCQRFAALAARNSRALDMTRPDTQALVALCQIVPMIAPQITSAAAARSFFEGYFVPNRVVHSGPPALLTAYYEPIIKGARAASPAFPEPIFRRPADLVNMVDEAQRGAVGSAYTHMRQTAAGLVPYATRADIDAGALKGQGLELLYLADPVEVFFLQVQGSGQIELPDRTRVRVAYDGKNGYPYTSVGRYLIDQGVMDANKMSLQALGEWLRADPVRGRAAMHQNKSYVFFRELTGAAGAAPLGVMEIPLTAGRSLALDPAHHAIGLPVYVSSDAITHIAAKTGFHRLMIAQDVGSAIKGPERGDLYVGSGDAAGKIAGITKHPGVFYVLTPRPAPGVAMKPSLDAAPRTAGSLPAKPKAP